MENETEYGLLWSVMQEWANYYCDYVLFEFVEEMFYDRDAEYSTAEYD